METQNTIALSKAQDPSRTIALRNAFSRAMKRKFLTFLKTVIEVVDEDNVFGLVVNRKPGQGAFAFPATADKVGIFMKWLQEQIQNEILQVTQIETVGSSVTAAWTNSFILAAYKRGIIRARIQLIQAQSTLPLINTNRKPKRKRTVLPLSQTGGVEAALSTPVHAERLSMLYSRTFIELKGVTESMSNLIAKALANGLMSGMTEKELAKHIVRVVSGGGGTLGMTDSLGRFIPATRRAEMIARTEIIRAHAEAQLTEFSNWGVNGVVGKAEILTTKDERTCPKCLRLEKQVFTIDEARGIIPVHTMCRCVWVPFLGDSKKK